VLECQFRNMNVAGGGVCQNWLWGNYIAIAHLSTPRRDMSSSYPLPPPPPTHTQLPTCILPSPSIVESARALPSSSRGMLIVLWAEYKARWTNEMVPERTLRRATDLHSAAGRGGSEAGTPMADTRPESMLTIRTGRNGLRNDVGGQGNTPPPAQFPSLRSSQRNVRLALRPRWWTSRLSLVLKCVVSYFISPCLHSRGVQTYNQVRRQTRLHAAVDRQKLAQRDKQRHLHLLNYGTHSPTQNSNTHAHVQATQ